jgi:FKBP-type peptidyl-prolyl cis-trans isomerase
MQAQQALEQKRLDEGESFLAANGAKEDVITTASGLQYQILAEGEGAQPGAEDRVKIKYRGTFLDGKEFENTDKLQRGYTICLVKGVIPGWTEAFQLMRAGGKYRLFIPSRLAYGKIGRDPDIPSNTLLIYDMELVAINPEN